MKRPRIESVYFGGREYERLAGVLSVSAKHHCPNWDINIRKIDNHNLKAALSSKYVNKGLFPNNAHKALEWCRIVKESANGDRLLLIDADTFIRASIDEIWDLDFDYARTVRDYKWPWNSGVMFLRVNERTKLFFDYITEETFKMLRDAKYHAVFEERYGGIHQASIASVIDRNVVPDFKVIDIPCKIWNSEHTSRSLEDFRQAKIVHLLPSGRKKITKGASWTKDKKWFHIGKEWHSWHMKSQVKYRWDEIIDRLVKLHRDNNSNLKIAEIGVWQGDIVKRIIPFLKMIDMYYLVDNWKSGTPGTDWYESGSKMPRFKQSRYDSAFRLVRTMTKGYRDKINIYHMDSVDAARAVRDHSLDLVFIDANHSYKGVVSDIEAWLPKVKIGGYIGGHDFDEPRFPGVRQGVELHFGRDIELGDDYTWFKLIKEA